MATLQCIGSRCLIEDPLRLPPLVGQQLGLATFGRDPLSLLLVWPSNRQSVTSWSREFVILFDGVGTGIGKIWYRNKSRNRSRKKFGTEKSLGTGLGQIFGLVTHGYQNQ